jgi:4-hydroxyacetophenone monooxygenase
MERADRMEQGNDRLAPIMEDDATLETLIGDLGIVVLMVATVHLTGDLDLLRRWPKPRAMRFTADSSGQFTAEQEATIRADALTAIKAYRDAGSPAPYRPTAPEILEMASFMGAAEVSDAYLGPLVEELEGAADPRAFRWSRDVGAAAKARHPVLVIGAGMSGILAAIRLQQAGIPFRVVEKNPGAGGTWHENRYPGCRVDIPSTAYSFSFMQDYQWPSLYSVQADLEAYFQACVDRYGLAPHIDYGVEAIRCDWDEERRLWSIRLRAADGGEEIAEARSVVSAVGFLNRPFVPTIPGADEFNGRAFHTARWPADLALEGKRIAVIGNAATGMQAIPELAKAASSLTIFQRTPQYLSIHPEYHRPIRTGEAWAVAHLPYFAGWMRALASNWPNDREPKHMLIDPEWPQDGLSVSAANAGARQRYVAAIEGALAGRPDLIDKVTPRYPAFTKRPCVTSGGFYEAIKQDHVTLVTEGIARFTADGIVDNDGVSHPLDIVVFATGFDVQKFVSPILFHGRGGVELHDHWGSLPGGYLGIVVPNFPNFYMMYGPGTNLGYNGNQIFNAECQVRFVTGAIGKAIEADLDAIEIRAEVTEDYLERTRAKLRQFVWSAGHSTSYFRNANGEVTTNSPWSLLQYWQWTKAPSLGDFEIWPRKTDAAHAQGADVAP